jgi:hypothetical protein
MNEGRDKYGPHSKDSQLVYVSGLFILLNLIQCFRKPGTNTHEIQVISAFLLLSWNIYSAVWLTDEYIFFFMNKICSCTRANKTSFQIVQHCCEWMRPSFNILINTGYMTTWLINVSAVVLSSKMSPEADVVWQ